MNPCLRRSVCFFAAALFASGWALADTAAPVWSQPVHGLRARLYTLPSAEPEFDKTFDLWIEIQEVGVDTSLGTEHKAVTIRYVSDNSQFQVEIADSKGTDVPASVKAAGGVDSPGPVDNVRELVLPPKGDLSFPIAYGGSSPHHPPPGGLTPKGRLLVFDTGREWLIPSDGGPYHLAASLVVSNSDGQMSNAVPYAGWKGTLVLPPIELPAR
jgi:hypothetical protein